MNRKQKRRAGYVTGAALVLTAAIVVVMMGDVRWAFAHKAKHSPLQLQAFDQVFIEQVTMGDRLFHGDASAERQMGVTLTKTGMSCAMCHPRAADTHPHEYPKFQEQMNKFATLREMINWCIEKPNEGEIIDGDSDAMKALEAYIYWSNRGSQLDPGRH